MPDATITNAVWSVKRGVHAISSTTSTNHIAPNSTNLMITEVSILMQSYNIPPIFPTVFITSVVDLVRSGRNMAEIIFFMFEFLQSVGGYFA